MGEAVSRALVSPGLGEHVRVPIAPRTRLEPVDAPTRDFESKVLPLPSRAVDLPGTDADFVAFYRSQQRALLRLGHLMTGSRTAAEDAFAEAVATMLPKWRRGGIEHPEAYLRRALVNRLISRSRRTKVAATYEARLRLDETIQGGHESSLVIRQTVMAAVLDLPPRQRATVVLRYLLDMSEEDTARALGTSTGTVKSQLSKALKRMRATIGEVDA